MYKNLKKFVCDFQPKHALLKYINNMILWGLMWPFHFFSMTQRRLLLYIIYSLQIFYKDQLIRISVISDDKISKDFVAKKQHFTFKSLLELLKLQIVLVSQFLVPVSAAILHNLRYCIFFKKHLPVSCEISPELLSTQEAFN